MKKGTQVDLTKIKHTDPRFNLYNNLQTDAARFAKFREAQKARELKEAQTDLDKQRIEKKYKEYLKTEKQAIFAHSAAAERWMGFEENADLYPNLEYRTAGDSDVRPEHAKLDGIILPMKDSFWNAHTPPLGFGCRCELIQTDSPVNKKQAKYKGFEKTTAPKGFDFNPGIEQKLFSESAGYYTSASGTEAAKLTKEAKTFIIRNSRNYGKAAINTTVKSKIGEIKLTKPGIDEVINQPHKAYSLKNMLMENPKGLLAKLKFKTVGDFKRNANVKQYHVAQLKLGEVDSWVIVREYNNGEKVLWTIVDNFDQYTKRLK